MDKHQHRPVPTAFFCEECGGLEARCEICNTLFHICEGAAKKAEKVLRKGYRVIPAYPDYMVNRQCNVRHIPTGRPCWLERVTRDNQALITVQKDGKKFVESAQQLRDSAFHEDTDLDRL